MNAKMNRFYLDRDTSGPEFDNKLIKLVRANPAIYDVNHPHYRRNPVRVAIWDRIAQEMGASSKFLQTKWKNIRYNYLQEVKCMETGQTNANIRKRRFTEDLSFLQHTAQTYNVKKGAPYNGSDNDNSNSFLYPDMPEIVNPYEVIEIDNSNDGSTFPDFDPKVSQPQLDSCYNSADDSLKRTEPTPPHASDETKQGANNDQLTQGGLENEYVEPQQTTPVHSPYSNPSSPLLRPLVVMGNGDDNGQETVLNGEVTIERKSSKKRIQVPPSQIMANQAKRKSMPAPFPVLSPINDPIELYCLSLVDSLRNMPRTERERVKFEFSKILKDAKYKDES